MHKASAKGKSLHEAIKPIQFTEIYELHERNTGHRCTFDLQSLNKDPRELLVSLLRPLCKENKAHYEIGIHAGDFSKRSIKRIAKFPD